MTNPVCCWLFPCWPTTNRFFLWLGFLFCLFLKISSFFAQLAFLSPQCIPTADYSQDPPLNLPLRDYLLFVPAQLSLTLWDHSESQFHLAKPSHLVHPGLQSTPINKQLVLSTPLMKKHWPGTEIAHLNWQTLLGKSKLLNKYHFLSAAFHQVGSLH